jgi:ribonucleoside-diphosphate reductase alpha chain
MKNLLPTAYQEYIHLSRYARWDDNKNRREFWPETVDRYINFWISRLKEEELFDDKTSSLIENIRKSIYSLDVMPSMRALMTAGPALERDHMAGYNCSYVAIDNPRAFDEIMYILMCGTGVGFSVERQYVSELPVVSEEFHATDTVIAVPDNKIGWASSFRELLALLYTGSIPRWDLSQIRPAGSRLVTFGGRASGPEPLDALFRFACNLFKNAAGRKLNSLEAHDLCCKIADIVVVGGVRRSALISLSNLSDDRMRAAKNGQWWEHTPHRQLANNSAAYTERPDFEVFLKEWLALYESKAGERGIFNRVAAQKKAAENGRRKPADFGTNPCAEILLRSKGLCNLTEVVIRPEDDLKSLRRKVEMATVLGTLQSTLTKFRYVRSSWAKNAEEERLLGVSLTGIVDHPMLSQCTQESADVLATLKQLSIDVNKRWSDKLGINQSVAITCVKPSGTVSQLVNSSSGIHPRYNTYYIRRVIGDGKDPITKFMVACGVPHQKSVSSAENIVFEFPIKAPDGALTRKDVDAFKQLELYANYRKNWCEHNPSTTVYYEDSNYLGVGQWVWENFDSIGGVALLPTDSGNYVQAPYEDISKEEYEHRASAFPTLDWTKLAEYETTDTTQNSHSLACSAGLCEI